MDYTPISFDRIYAYLRKSRADGETETVEEVLAKHEAMMQEYMERIYGKRLPPERIFREVQSGETISSRPIVQMLIGMIQNGRVDGLFVVDLQRISRGDLSDAGEFSRLFRFTKCRIITPQRVFDISDDFDRKYFEQELMRANDYLEYTKKIMGRGRLQSVKNGNFIGSIPPYGYDKVFVNKRPTLSPNPVEAPVVQLIFDLYANSSLGPAKIAHHLDSLGIRTRSGKSWAGVSVRDIVENPVYIGKLRWNWRAAKHTYIDGQISKTRPRADEYTLADGIHEPLVSEELFEKAKLISASRKKSSNNYNKHLVNPYAGILYCTCGYVMTFQYSKPSNPAAPRVPLLYCSGRGCSCRGANLDKITAHIIASMAVTLDLYASNLDNSPTAYDTTQALIASYEKELAESRRQQTKLYEFLERGIYSESVFAERSAVIKQRIDSLTNELLAARESSRTTLSHQDFCTSLSRCIDILPDPNVSAEEKNALLKKLCKKIVYFRQQTTRNDPTDTPIDLRIFYNI